MNKRDRSTVLLAAAILDQYAEELRRSNVVNGTWKGEGVTKIRDEWVRMIKTARELRTLAEQK